MIITQEAFDYLQTVKNQPLLYITRALDMAVFSFGDRIDYPDRNGKEDFSGTFDLHVTCFFRMISNGRIILSRDDFYLPPEQGVERNWDIRDGTLFDTKVKVLKSQLEGQIVKKVEISEFGDLQITLSNSVLQVFVQVSDHVQEEEYEYEEWRFFDRRLDKDTPHLVMESGISELSFQNDLDDDDPYEID